jgi:hypothetical protein
MAARDARDARALHRFASWCLNRGWWWSWDVSLLAATLLGAQQTGATIPWARPIFEAYVAGTWFLFWTDDALYWVAKPTVHVEHVNGTRRLHCETGPAIESDAENLYFWRGLLVPAFAVTRPEWITPAHIADEENAEVRRVLIERMGWDRWLAESGAQPIASDRYGDLYETELDGARLGVVVVTNSTPEPDGHYKRYSLRVPAGFRTAHAAVASTFGLTEATYQPALES